MRLSKTTTVSLLSARGPENTYIIDYWLISNMETPSRCVIPKQQRQRAIKMLHYRLEHCAQLFTQICHLRFCGNTIYKYTIFVTILPCQSYICTIENICSIENICAIENMSQHTNAVKSHRERAIKSEIHRWLWHFWHVLFTSFSKLKSYIWKRQHWLWLWSSSSLWVDTNIYICAATTARRPRQKLHNNCDSI